MKRILLPVVYGFVIACIADQISPHYPLFSPADWRETFMWVAGMLLGYVAALL